MLSRAKLKAALGAEFVTKRRIADVLGYKDARSVNKYIEGVERISGPRYWSEGVIDNIMEELEER